MAEPINRQILAQIKGCKNTDTLNGMCCTNNCEYRKTCTIQRTKLVIPAITISMDKNDIKKQKIKSISGLSIKIFSMKPDAYLNEHTGMFTSEIKT